MDVKVSSKYQIVIPKNVRRKLQIMPGDRVRIKQLDKYAQLSKAPSIQERLEAIRLSSSPTNTNAVGRVRKLRDEWDS